ncbi:MAG: DNA polymerase I, partial [Phycisphaerae bacterium]|nr:DNA polymerase I [Phycisphaerae bacterium]
MAKTLYIIDGHSQIYRAYYAPFRDLTSPTGEPTRATYVFSRMLLRFIVDRRPDYLAMAIDGPAEKLHRRKAFADYKATRKPMPDDLPPQVERILQIVETMRIPILQAEGYEADDILATAVEKLACDDLHVVLISRDKDLEQLVSPHVVLYDPMKDETIDAAVIEQAKGYPPEKAIEVQALAGDSIDNIPGIPGVGPKTAAKLISEYGSAEAVLANADKLTPKLRARVLENADNIALSKELVTLVRHVPIDLDLTAMKLTPLQGKALRPIFAELGFDRLLTMLDDLGIGGPDEAVIDASAPTEPKTPQSDTTTAADFEYSCVDTPEKLSALAKQLAGAGRLAIDTETTSTRPMWAELVGLSLAWRPGEAVYVPVKAPLGAKTLDVELVREKLGPLLASEKIEKVGH